MDINARIRWTPGLKLTASALNGFEGSIDSRIKSALHAAFSGRFGIIPGIGYNCNTVFVRNTIELDLSDFIAVLPSGELINVDEKLTLTVPKLEDGDYYLTVGIGEDGIDFESEGVPYRRPQYVCRICSAEEADGSDCIAVAHLTILDATVSIDRSFIIPCLKVSSIPDFREISGKLAARLEAIATHRNMEEGDCKRTFLHYLFMVRGFDPEMPVQDFIAFTREVAGASLYWWPREEKKELPRTSGQDINRWLLWLDACLAEVTVWLDAHELVDDSIDYNALKAEIREDVYAAVRKELEEKFSEDIRKAGEDLHALLENALKDFIETDFKNRLHDEIGADLLSKLRDSLYQSLYDALYSALYVPEEEDNFTPII